MIHVLRIIFGVIIGAFVIFWSLFIIFVIVIILKTIWLMINEGGDNDS